MSIPTKTQDFQLSTEASESRSGVATVALANGGTAGVWLVDDEMTRGLRGLVVGPEGSMDHAEFLIDAEDIDFAVEPTIAALADGGFVVVWCEGVDGAVRVCTAAFDEMGNEVDGGFQIDQNSTQFCRAA